MTALALATALVALGAAPSPWTSPPAADAPATEIAIPAPTPPSPPLPSVSSRIAAAGVEVWELEGVPARAGFLQLGWSTLVPATAERRAWALEMSIAFAVGSTEAGLATRDFRYEILWSLAPGAFRLGAGVDLGLLVVRRATSGAAMGALEAALTAAASADVVAWDRGAVFVRVQGWGALESGDQDLLLLRGAALAGVRF